MTRLAFYSVLSLLIAPNVFANDVIGCDASNALVPNAVSRFEKTVDFPETPGFLVYIAPNNSMTLEKQVYMNQLRGQIDSLAGIPHRYWICTDVNPVDGTLESVAEMTQAQKDAMDAPDLAESQRQQEFTNEIDTNNFCTAELADLDTRIDTAVDAAPNNIAGVKTLLKAALKKIARCVRARAR